MAADEHSPIRDDEYLIRRVTRSKYAPDADPSCYPEAFYPSGRDADGISFVRESCSDVGTIAERFQETMKGKPFFLLRLRAGDIRSIGLSVQPSPSKGLAGHSVIPELNHHAWQGEGWPKLMEQVTRLAVLASNPEALACRSPDLRRGRM